MGAHALPGLRLSWYGWLLTTCVDVHIYWAALLCLVLDALAGPLGIIGTLVDSRSKANDLRRVQQLRIARRPTAFLQR